MDWNEAGRVRLGGRGGLGMRRESKIGGEVDWERDKKSKARTEKWIGKERG